MPRLYYVSSAWHLTCLTNNWLFFLSLILFPPYKSTFILSISSQIIISLFDYKFIYFLHLLIMIFFNESENLLVILRDSIANESNNGYEFVGHEIRSPYSHKIVFINSFIKNGHTASSYNDDLMIQTEYYFSPTVQCYCGAYAII